MYSIPTTWSPLSGFIRRVLCPALKKNRKIVIGTYFARLKVVTRLIHEKDFQKAASLGKVWRETKINISPPALKWPWNCEIIRSCPTDNFPAGLRRGRGSAGD